MSDNVPWLRVRKWDEWQSYRSDRGAPPWIKVHRRLLLDVEWSMLADAEKGQLVSIWILAADRNGWVPGNPLVLQRLLGLGEPPNLRKFIDLQFLEGDDCHADVIVTSERRQSDRPEAEAEAEAEADSVSPSDTTADDNERMFVDVFDRPPPMTPEIPQPDPPAPQRSDSQGNRFAEFWAAYPSIRKREKKRALEIWKRKKLDAKADEIIADVERRKARDPQWLKDGGQYVPMPTTYLNGERWDDELPSEGNGRKTGEEDPRYLPPDDFGRAPWNPDGSRNHEYRGGTYWQ